MIAFPDAGGMKSQEFPRYRWLPDNLFFFFFYAGLPESLLPSSDGLSKEHIKDVDMSLIN